MMLGSIVSSDCGSPYMMDNGVCSAPMAGGQCQDGPEGASLVEDNDRCYYAPPAAGEAGGSQSLLRNMGGYDLTGAIDDTARDLIGIFQVISLVGLAGAVGVLWMRR